MIRICLINPKRPLIWYQMSHVDNLDRFHCTTTWLCSSPTMFDVNRTLSFDEEDLFDEITIDELVVNYK